MTTMLLKAAVYQSRAALRRWLALFDAAPQAGLPAYLGALADRERGALTVEPLYRDYAYLLRYRRPPAP